MSITTTTSTIDRIYLRNKAAERELAGASVIYVASQLPTAMRERIARVEIREVVK